MRDTVITLLAWAAVIATQLLQRVIIPVGLVILDGLGIPSPGRTPTAAPSRLAVVVPIAADHQQLERLSCRQLRAMAGIKRHLPKQALIEILLQRSHTA
jgi:hypothetical protein